MVWTSALSNGVIITERRLSRSGEMEDSRVNSRVLFMSSPEAHLRDSQNKCRSPLRGTELPGMSLRVAKVRKMDCIVG